MAVDVPITKFIRWSVNPRRLGVLAIAVLVVSVPAAGQQPTSSQPVFIKEPHEIQMGRDIDDCLVATRRFLEDSAWDHYLHDLGARLAATSERPGLPWTFRVLDVPVVNAFALPGGFVYVTRGLLEHLNSEAQLAAVLGHEIGHVAARHVGGQSARRELERRGLVAGTTGSSLTQLYGDVVGTQALLAANSREAEQEADGLGLRYMSEAGYDPMEMVSVLRMLDRTVHSVSPLGVDEPLPEWLATHPSPERRIEGVVRKRAELLSAGTRIERDTYLARVSGLAYGPDARPGFFKGHRFVVPARGYQVTFPKRWLLTNVGTAARAETPDHDAVLDLRARDERTADSAASIFFGKVAKLRGSLSRDQVGSLLVVRGSFTWLPYWVKVRGMVAFIESRGTVYQLTASTSNGRWSDYEEEFEETFRTLESVPDSEIARAQPLRVATFSLRDSTSVAALYGAKGAAVTADELAILNQVPADSVLPPGHVVKWIGGPAR
ncbi:MAG TPA: M48 family metalloprotease [Gemmatimonadales bacterium]|nr:M48 family metalloprotease [Gemmatimonadales bacterium]